jgi:hypothetical protein
LPTTASAKTALTAAEPANASEPRARASNAENLRKCVCQSRSRTDTGAVVPDTVHGRAGAWVDTVEDARERQRTVSRKGECLPGSSNELIEKEMSCQE